MASPKLMGAGTVLFATLFLAAGVVLTAKGGNDGLCGMTQAELFECREAVATGSVAPPPPTKPCCDALGHADLQCFCGFKNNKYLPMLGINTTRAMQLPSVCNPSQTVHCSS